MLGLKTRKHHIYFPRLFVWRLGCSCLCLVVQIITLPFLRLLWSRQSWEWPSRCQVRNCSNLPSVAAFFFFTIIMLKKKKLKKLRGVCIRIGSVIIIMVLILVGVLWLMLKWIIIFKKHTVPFFLSSTSQPPPPRVFLGGGGGFCLFQYPFLLALVTNNTEPSLW